MLKNRLCEDYFAPPLRAKNKLAERYFSTVGEKGSKRTFRGDKIGRKKARGSSAQPSL